MSIEASAVPKTTDEIEHRGIDPSFPVREAPTVGLEAPTGRTDAQPDASGEQVLEVADIQGNVVGGFNKNFQTLLFLRIDEEALFKPWLVEFAKRVASAAEVIAFNRLYKRARDRRGYSGTVRSTWVNIAFTHAGLAKLTDVAEFADTSFRNGLVGRSSELGDPTAADAEGNPAQWLVRDGEVEDAAHVLIIVAADTLPDLELEVAQVEQLIFSPRLEGVPARSGVSVVFKQEGRHQAGAMAGHEHFGFLDGVSQPGLRGRVSDNKYDVLTLRQNPDDPDEGKPGQALVWPGEFVFGYWGQDATKDFREPGPDSLFDDEGERVAPDWAKNGSYLVFRRLRQDVFGFHSFLQQRAALLGLTPDGLGAKVVGRWASGAPTTRAPDLDNPPLGGNDCANNHFQFQAPTEPTRNEQGEDRCSDTRFPQSPGDPSGDICPLSSHIRKAHPRDDVEAAEMQTRRLLRRGIQFGPSSRSTPSAPADDRLERGLLFMAYMTSITDQFEFVMRRWINDPDLPLAGAGVDALLGRSPDGESRRTFSLRVRGRLVPLKAADWIAPTGGGYFFAPSISALTGVLGGKGPSD